MIYAKPDSGQQKRSEPMNEYHFQTSLTYPTSAKKLQMFVEGQMPQKFVAKERSLVDLLRMYSLGTSAESIDNRFRLTLPTVKKLLDLQIIFRSLGDVVKGALLLQIFSRHAPPLHFSIMLTDEYNDYEPVMAAMSEKYACDVSSSKATRPVQIGCFDTGVTAYLRDTRKYDALFPVQYLAPFHVLRCEVPVLEAIRKRLQIEYDDRILVLSSYSTVPEENLSFKSTLTPKLITDFRKTNNARYIPVGLLSRLIQIVVAKGVFNKVILIPRNVHEEMMYIDQMKASGGVTVITDATYCANTCSCLILAAKGVSRALYALADAVVVFGYHNVLEPLLCNPNARVFATPPPRSSPNFSLWQCAVRLSHVGYIPERIATDGDVHCIVEKLADQGAQRMSLPIDFRDLENDPYVRYCSWQVSEALRHLSALLSNRCDGYNV